MGTLSVFSVEGHQLHPEGGDGFESRYAAYVGNVRLRADLNPERPFLEAYVRVRTEERKEQVYVRYEGERPADLFTECRDAVERELVEGRGWAFSKRSHTEPSKLFTDLVLQPTSSPTPSLEETVLTDDPALVAEILDSGDRQLTIHARNYTYLGGLVAEYAESGRSIVVAENPQTQTDATLRLLHSSKYGTLGVPDETVETIRAVRDRRQRVRRREQYEQIQAAFAELAVQDVDAEKVVRELQPRISKHFGRLRLETGRQNTGSQPDSGTLHRPSVSKSNEGERTRIAHLFRGLFGAVPRPQIGSMPVGGLTETDVPSERIGYVALIGVLLVLLVFLIMVVVFDGVPEVGVRFPPF